MDYFKDLQIDSIWISPFFESSKLDMGYDVSNYNKVDPEFGTLADFEELSKEAEKRGYFSFPILYSGRIIFIKLYSYKPRSLMLNLRKQIILWGNAAPGKRIIKGKKKIFRSSYVSTVHIFSTNSVHLLRIDRYHRAWFIIHYNNLPLTKKLDSKFNLSFYYRLINVRQ